MSTLSYIPGAQVLAYSISKWLQADTELVMLVIHDRGMNSLGMESLRAAHWTVKVVNRIAPPRPENTMEFRLRDLYTKFSAWNMTEYSQILLLDADIIIMKSMDNLLHSGIKFSALARPPRKYCSFKPNCQCLSF